MNEYTTLIETCEACRLVPLSHLSLDLPEPIGGWSRFLDDEGIDVQVDDLGRPSIARSVFGAMVRAQASRVKLKAERAALAAASAPTKQRFAGAPAQEGLSPFESMIRAEADYVTPAEEFDRLGGRERPNWIAEQIDAGNAELAKSRAEAAEKKRLTEQMKEDLA